MSHISNEEFLRVNQLLVEQRCDYALQHIAKNTQLWGLKGQQGWILLTTGEDVCLPVWPYEQFARAWEKDEYPDCKPEPISLTDWCQQWLPGMQQNGTLVLVFPVGDEEEGIILGAEEMQGYLQEELAELNSELPTPTDNQS